MGGQKCHFWAFAMYISSNIIMLERPGVLYISYIYISFSTAKTSNNVVLLKWTSFSYCIWLRWNKSLKWRLLTFCCHWNIFHGNHLERVRVNSRRLGSSALLSSDSASWPSTISSWDVTIGDLQYVNSNIIF